MRKRRNYRPLATGPEVYPHYQAKLDKGNCAPLSIAYLTGLPYPEVRAACIRNGYDPRRGGMFIPDILKTLRELGFLCRPMPWALKRTFRWVVDALNELGKDRGKDRTALLMTPGHAVAYVGHEGIPPVLGVDIRRFGPRSKVAFAYAVEKAPQSGT